VALSLTVLAAITATTHRIQFYQENMKVIKQKKKRKKKGNKQKPCDRIEILMCFFRPKIIITLRGRISLLSIIIQITVLIFSVNGATFPSTSSFLLYKTSKLSLIRDRGLCCFSSIFLSSSPSWSSLQLSQRLVHVWESSSEHMADRELFVFGLLLSAKVELLQSNGSWHGQTGRSGLTCSSVNRFREVGVLGVSGIPSEGARKGGVLDRCS